MKGVNMADSKVEVEMIPNETAICKPIVNVEKIVTTNGTFNVYMHNRHKNVSELAMPFPEAPAHPSMLTIQSFNEPEKVIVNDGTCTVKAQYTTEIGPRQQARINLGISITPPVGTYITVSSHKMGIPSNAWVAGIWEIADHRLDRDSRGEAIATVSNSTDEKY